MIDDNDEDDDNHLIKANLHFSGKEDDEMTSAMIFGINWEYIHTIFEMRGTSIAYIIPSLLPLLRYMANKTKRKSIRTLC